MSNFKCEDPDGVNALRLVAYVTEPRPSPEKLGEVHCDGLGESKVKQILQEIWTYPFIMKS